MYRVLLSTVLVLSYCTHITLQLKDEIVVTGVTLEHISRDLSPNGAIRSAPKDFTVLVWACTLYTYM